MNGISDVRINCIERMYNLITDNGADDIAARVLRETAHFLERTSYTTVDFLRYAELGLSNLRGNPNTVRYRPIPSDYLIRENGYFPLSLL